jgi:branched-chain amino acid transport system substrate-binding protein
MISRRKILIGVAAALAVVVSVSACSTSSNSSTSATAGSTGSGQNAATGSPVKIGVLCSCSGPFGTTIAAAWNVVQAWGKSVNASGGLNGHPVDLTEMDNASNPGTAATDAQKMISANPAAIIDLDILDAIWQKPASAAKIPVIGGNFSSAQYFTDPNWYPSGQTNDSITYSVVATAKQAGAKNLGQLYCAESVQCQQSVPLIKADGKALGIPDVYNASIAATAPNYTAQCLAAKQAGVTAVFIGDSTSVIARVAENCSQQGYNPIYVTEGTGFTDQALSTPGLKDNLWSPYPVLPFFSAASAVTAMNTVLDKYYPGMTQNSSTWSEFAAQAWTAGLLIARAVKNAGVTAGDTVSAADIAKGLGMVSNDTLGGFSPSLTFAAGQPHKVDCWYVGRVQGGKATQVGGLTCEKGAP